MVDRPILFSAPMVRALLAGTKTQTRRVIKPQPSADFISASFDTAGALTLCPAALAFSPLHNALRRLHKLGDRLWVREAWHAARSLDRTPPRDIPRDADIEHAATARSYAEIGLKGKLRPGIHMPRWASRLTLIVTDVRVQRLQDISEEDARAEGAYVAPRSGRVADDYVTMAIAGSWFASGRGWYADLWDRINGTGSWAANPWIAAYTFTVHQQNIDAMPAGDRR